MSKGRWTLPPTGSSGTRLPTFDNAGFFSKVFMYWVRSWVDFVGEEKCNLESVHELPQNDQLSWWQTVFARHISDGLLQLEKSETAGSSPLEPAIKPYRSIFLRAMVLTFWRRALLTLLGILCVNLIGIGTAILLKYLLDLLSTDSQRLSTVFRIVLGVVLVETTHSILHQHVELFIHRIEICIEAVITITLFQHGLCYRRPYSSVVDSGSQLGTCKKVVHFSGPDESCTPNPLLCPARRHQNRELPPSIYTHMVLDATTITNYVASVMAIVSFACNFFVGMVFVRTSMGFPVLLPTLTVTAFVFFMLVLELVNGRLRRYSLESMDCRASVSSDVLGNLQLCTAMGIDDVGYRAIESTREDELTVLRVRLFFQFLNRAMERSVGILVFWVFVYVFNKEVSKGENGEVVGFDVNELISVMFIVTKIVLTCGKLPKAFRWMVESATSYRRVEAFLRNCSPNFYLDANNEETVSEPTKVDERSIPPDVSIDTVVYFKDASFSYINNRKLLLDTDQSSRSPLFKSLNVQLKRGEIRIITGNQGCGKTSFIKSILGDMSLVSGSMAVAPLSTGMPIFYTSQEVWLPSGSIRSIITFGYAFDEDIYNRVTSAVELESDFASWEDGDMRVISEKGYSLSGGQRVRLSLARALYSYLVFSKANERSEGDRCCFLVCLDEPLNGLDSSVARSILRNLLNRKNGLLVHHDVAVVMAMSTMTLDIAMTPESVTGLSDVSVGVIENGTLSDPMSLEMYLGFDLTGDDPSTESESDDVRYSAFGKMACRESVHSVGKYRAVTTGMSTFDHEPPVRTLSFVPSAGGGRPANIWSGYLVYFRAVGYFILFVLVFSILVSHASVNIKLLLAAKWVDNLRKATDSSDVNDVMSHHRKYYVWITIFTFSSLACFLLLMFVVVYASMRGSRRLYDFALKSSFLKPSAVVQLKSCMGALMTFFTSDVHIIDEHIGYYIHETSYSFLSFLVKFATLCYVMPLAVPVPLVTCFLLYYFAHRKLIRASKILQRLMLDANSNVNVVYNDVMTGSSVYRSFRKESKWLQDVRARSDEYYRTHFLKAAYTMWVTLATNVGAAMMIAVFITIPVLRSYVAGEPHKVGHLGVAISLCLGFGNSLRALITNYSQLERYMCSVARFESFFMQDGSSLDEKFDSMSENLLYIPPSYGRVASFVDTAVTSMEIDEASEPLSPASVDHYSVNIPNGPDEDVGVAQQGTTFEETYASLLHRRIGEYRSYYFRRYISLFGWVFYKPVIEVLPASDYLPPATRLLELKDVSLMTPSPAGTVSTHHILRDVSFCARAGEVIGVMGRTGAGKSTLLSVLQNVAPGRGGAVLMDSVELNTIPRKVLRHIIGVLPQLPFIFKGWTLRRFLDPRMLYSDDEIMHALDCCGMLDLVKSLPGGSELDTVLVPEESSAVKKIFLAPPLCPLSGKGWASLSSEAPHSSNPPDGHNRIVLSVSQQRQLWFARLVLYRRMYRIILIDEPQWAEIADDDDEVRSCGASEVSYFGTGKSICSLVYRYFSHCITFLVTHDRRVLRRCSRLLRVKGGVVSDESSLMQLWGGTVSLYS
ncbi:ABC transporter family protein [Babesia ovata]|uniref:ABC transporter family protein n=1 Tax=Babesia ovata TaxID=189622 RepID=A0A2H6K7I1_9APIC|nr:ABC transporter family protein [Babesia ovata]GBE58944.1 ABC transporter family protein [Babesia ovata]